MEQTSIHPVELLAVAPRPLFLVGEGLKYHPRELAPDDSENGLKWLPETDWTPRAENVLRCGWCRARQGKFVNPDSLTPLYLRRPEAVEKWEKRQGEK